MATTWLSTEKETTPALGIGDTVAVSTCVGDAASGATLTAVTVGAGPLGVVVGTVVVGVPVGVVVGTVVVGVVVGAVVGAVVGGVGTVVVGVVGTVVGSVVVGVVVGDVGTVVGVVVGVVGTVVGGVVVGVVVGPATRRESIEPSEVDPPRWVKPKASSMECRTPTVSTGVADCTG